MDAVERLLERLSQALFFVALLAGAAMMLHVTLEAFSRTALSAPLSGTYEVVAAYYMIAAAFLPWAALALRDQHITVELFTERVGRRWRDAMGLFTQALTIAYMVIFTWQSVVGAQRRMDRGEVLEIPTGYLTVWPARWMLPVVGGLMLACLLFRLAADIRRMARGDHGRA